MDSTGNFDVSHIYVKILEQPAQKALRFRYECEGRSAGSIPGSTSTAENKTFPKIKVVGYRGRAVALVSCVTEQAPYRPHPHNLVGKDGCKKGVCSMPFDNDEMTCEFSNLGIQCVKKKDIEESLQVRRAMKVDPFFTGFEHMKQPGSIDLNAVRLCFQVFLENQKGRYSVRLKPVVSDTIFDKKAMNDLNIMKLSECTSPAMGNKEIILLCDKVTKDDIEVRFFEEADNGYISWEAMGIFQPTDVHKQYAISFLTPQYRDLGIQTPADVQIQLRCPSKDSTSIPRRFTYVPHCSDTQAILRRKRAKSQNLSVMDSYLSTVGQQNPLPLSPLPESQPQEILYHQRPHAVARRQTPSPAQHQQQPMQSQGHLSPYQSPYHAPSVPSPSTSYQMQEQSQSPRSYYSPSPPTQPSFMHYPQVGSTSPGRQPEQSQISMQLPHHYQQQQQKSYGQKQQPELHRQPHIQRYPQQQGMSPAGIPYLKDEWNYCVPSYINSGGMVVVRPQSQSQPQPRLPPEPQLPSYSTQYLQNQYQLPLNIPVEEPFPPVASDYLQNPIEEENTAIPSLADLNLSWIDDLKSISGLCLNDDVQNENHAVP